MSKLRLHKAIAEAGIASRRAAEEMIRQGRVTVNGEIVTGMGVQVDPEKDVVTVDGKPMARGLKKRTYMIYKPAGVLCTRSDPRGRPTVYDLLPAEVSDGLHSAGRLDLDAEGMLILTNDGELSQALTHPSRHHHKTYLVTFKGEMDRRALRKMRNGIELDDGLTLPASVDVVRTMSNARETTVTLVLREGRKNQIKRMGDAVGHRVLSIKRTATGRLELPPKMKPGSYKKLSAKEIATLAGGRGERSGRMESTKGQVGSPLSRNVDPEKGRRGGQKSPKSNASQPKPRRRLVQSPQGQPRRGDAETRGKPGSETKGGKSRAEAAERGKAGPKEKRQYAVEGARGRGGKSPERGRANPKPKGKRPGADQQRTRSRKKP